MTTPDPPEPSESRRRALEVIVLAGSAACAGAMIGPAARLVVPSGGAASEGVWLRIARLDSVHEGEPTRAQVKGDQQDAFTVAPQVTLGSVWLLRRGGEITALSAECPHLGCAIDLSSDTNTAGKPASFACPCHSSRFALDGSSESGPSPRGMDPIPTRVVGGWIEVSWRRYRQGIRERVQVRG